ncbi:MAG: ATP-binding protein [Bacteroidota bacterium]
MEFTNKELENFARGTEVFMAILDQKGFFIKANVRWAQKFHLPSSEVVGSSIYQLMHEDSERDLKALMKEVKAKGQIRQEVLTMVDQSMVTFAFQIDLTYVEGVIYMVGFDVTEHAREHNSLAAMSKLAQTGAWYYDPLRDHTFWSDEVYRIHNLPVGSPIDAKMALDFYLPSFRKELDKLVERLYKEKKSYNFLGKIRTHSGKEKWLRTLAQPVVQKGEIIFINGVSIDQTRLQQNLEKIRAESETRRLALKGIKSGLFDHNVETDTAEYSPDFKKMIGLPMDTYLHEPEFRKLIHPDDRDAAYERHLLELKKPGNYYYNRYRLRHLDEGYEYYEIFGWRKKDEKGKAVRVVGNLINIHDRVVLAQERDRIRNSLEVMVDNGFIHSMLLDTEGVILMADEETLGIIRHDYSVDPMTERVRYVDVMPDIFKRSFQAEFDKAMAGETVRKEVERPLLEGAMQWLDVMYHPIVNSEGEVFQILTNLMDITDRKKAEISLTDSRNHAQALSRLKSGILSNMSHEMRTPLNGIMGVSSLLMQKELDAESTEMLTMQKESELRLLSTLNDLVTLSDLDAMRMRMKLKQHSLNELAQTVFEMYHHQAKMKKLKFHWVPSKTEGVILVDHEMMIGALSAVVNNALKYTEKGQVEIICHLDEQEWGQIRVVDTGVGIDPKDFNRIFENFEIANIGMNMKYEGTGIGLSISKKIIQLMGGSIEVVSELGKGADFSIRLPALVNLGQV